MNRIKEAKRIREEFTTKTKDSILALHWDEKLMTDLSRNKAERLAILVSSFPHCPEGKLIHVSTTADGKGATMADEIVKKIEEYGLGEHKFGSLVFDTTASNTGVRKGAATILEIKMSSELANFCGVLVGTMFLRGSSKHCMPSCLGTPGARTRNKCWSSKRITGRKLTSLQT